MLPLQRGFDHFVGFPDGDSHYYNVQLYNDNTRFFDTQYLTDEFTQEAVSFINAHASQPFFLYLAYNAARLNPQSSYHGMVSSLDIVPTVAAAAGVALPTDRDYDGVDIMPYLTGQQIRPVRTFCWRWFGLGPTGSPRALNTIWGVRNDSLKLVVERARDTQPPALYDLSTDIGETTDLSQQQPDQVAALQRLYNQWQLIAVPALWQKDSDNRFLPLVLPGDWNGFNIGDDGPPWSFSRITAPDPVGTPDAYNWLTTTIHVATTGGDTTPGTHQFVIVGHESYATQWGGATIEIDGVTEIRSFSGTQLGPTNTITFENNFYYSMRFVDANGAPNPGRGMSLVVMKTSAPPVTISRTGQASEYPTSSDPITVTMTTNQAKSAEERVYLRWSNDWFITSHVIEASPGGDGVTYTATIPPQSDGNSCFYTVLTSTADLTGYTASGIIDDLTLAVNGIFNALATPPTPTPTPTPTVRVTVGTNPAGLRFRVDGTTYSSIQTFTWASGSSHTVATISPKGGGTGVRHAWTTWNDHGAISHTVAPITNKTYTATFKTQYFLTMTPGNGGRVSPTSRWKNSGVTVSISATPNNGYSFSSWTGTGTGSYSGTNNPGSITMSGPITETATFIQN